MRNAARLALDTAHPTTWKVILGRPSGTGGAPGATRGGVVSKSATKAPRAGIGRGGNRGISTILLVRPDSIGAFVADLDTDRVRTGSDWSHATRAPHLSQVPLLAAPPGAEHGAPGGSFRGAPDCEAVRTAQSCGNRRTHPAPQAPYAPPRHTQNNLPGSLWQIWTTGAAAGPVVRASPASARSMTPTPARTPARRAVADRASAPFDRAGPARAPPRTPHRRPNPRDRHLTHENVPLADDLAGYPAISRTATSLPRRPTPPPAE